MPGSATPQPGWWRASDGLWYPPETLPVGWFIDPTGLARQNPPIPLVQPVSKLAAPPPHAPLPTRTPTFSLDPSPQKPPIARAWKRYLGWPLWAKVAAPIAVLVLLGGALDAVDRASGTKGGVDRIVSDGEARAFAAITSTTTAPTTRATTTTAAPLPPPTQPPAPVATCAASMVNASPAQGASVTVNVQSSLPNAPIVLVAHYKTTNSTYSGATGSTGSGSVSFRTGRPTVGYEVVVNVTVGAIARCSTSFTPY